MKNLEHTIRDILTKKQELSSEEFVIVFKQLEEKFLKYLEQNDLLREDIEENYYRELAQSFLNENAAVLRAIPPAMAAIQRGGAKVIDYLAKRAAAAPKTKPAPEKPGEVVPFPKTPATPKPAETPSPKVPETPSPKTPETPSPKVPETPPTSKPTETLTVPKGSELPSPAPKGGILKRLGRAAVAGAGAKLGWDLIKKLLNTDTGSGGGAVPTFHDPGSERHRAGPARTVESVESPGTKARKQSPNVGRPKLNRLRDILGKQGSIQKKTIDESTEQFLKKVRAAKEKDKTANSFTKPVKETETVEPAKDLNKESPDHH